MFSKDLSSQVRLICALSVFGAALLIAGSFSPLLQGTINSTEWNTFFVPGPPRNFSIFGVPAHAALVALAVLCVVVSFSSSRYLLLWLGGAATFAVLWSLRYCFRLRYDWYLLQERWHRLGELLSWGWFILLLGALCILLAGVIVQWPFQWWSKLQKQWDEYKNVQEEYRKLQRTNQPVPQEFGPCSECGTNNAHLATKCHKCGAILPWAEIKPQRVKAGTILPKSSTQAVPRARFSLDFGAFVVGFFCLVMPIIGYFVYRSYAEKGSERTAVAGWCTLVGFILVGLRVLVRVADLIVP